MERTTIAAVAAAIAGGLLLADQARRRARRNTWDEVESSLDQDVNVHLSTGTAVAGVVTLAAGAWYLSNSLRQAPQANGMSSVEESIELQVPVSTAYNQWTQFEEFPRFMATVQEVRQVDDTHLHWKAIVGGKPKEWDTEITEQTPDKRIAWRSTSGVPNGGVVTFHKVGDNRTRVMLQMDYRPETLTEKIGDAVGAVKLTAKGNLKRFKKLVEGMGHETGAWRGTVPQH